MPKKIENPKNPKKYETRPKVPVQQSQKKKEDEQEDYYTDSSERSSNDTSGSDHAHSCENNTPPSQHRKKSEDSHHPDSHHPEIQPGKVIRIRSEDEYNTILKTSSDSQLIIVKFSATWCGPCKAIAPKYDALSKHYTKCLFLYIDIDELEHASTVQDVSAVPTFKLFKKGAIVEKFSGADIPKLDRLIEKNK